MTDPSRNGVYAIRSSDGGGLTRITSNPDGDDIPGDYSPDGKQFLFGRMDPTRPARANVALFVINLDGTGLLRIRTPLPWRRGLQQRRQQLIAAAAAVGGGVGA